MLRGFDESQGWNKMFARGLVEETRDLKERYGPDLRPLGSLGYKQAMQCLAGELTLPQAIAAAQQGHRNYAKRQMTWFRREPDVHWIERFGSDIDVQEQCLRWINERSPSSP